MLRTNLSVQDRFNKLKKDCFDMCNEYKNNYLFWPNAHDWTANEFMNAISAIDQSADKIADNDSRNTFKLESIKALVLSLTAYLQSRKSKMFAASCKLIFTGNPDEFKPECVQQLEETYREAIEGFIYRLEQPNDHTATYRLYRMDLFLHPFLLQNGLINIHLFNDWLSQRRPQSTAPKAAGGGG